jgi:hypothetical protein
MRTDGRDRWGVFESFWGIGGVPAPLVDPNDAIFIVAMMENDNGDPQLARGFVDTAVNASLVESLAVARPGKVTTLMRDVDSARRIPTGAPNFDDTIGAPQELRFSADELRRAESRQTVSKRMVFEGDGGRYTLTFDARNPLANWQLLDNNPASVNIVADGNDLYQLHNNGRIWKFTGTPLTGWQELDNNPVTVNIIAASNNLYQIHSNGFIWKITG